MCGIAGLFDTRGDQTPHAELITRMTDAITHRGPDESGYHLEPGLALGHRRLSIIDIASGQQPLFNEERSVAIVFNGEVYNFARSAARVGITRVSLSYPFRHRGHPACLGGLGSRLRQAPARHVRICNLGSTRRHLFLARDRLGIKPLYYALLPNGQFIFGSELKALLPHPGLPRTRDARRSKSSSLTATFRNPGQFSRESINSHQATRC